MPNPTNIAFKAINKVSSLIGNPGQIMEKGIYKNALDSDKLGPYRVTISGPTHKVDGLLTNNLAMNISAKWEASDLISELASSNPILGKIHEYGSMLAGASGVANINNVGVSTRKIYSGSGYLEFDVQFRVVDWLGKGDPIFSCFLLSTFCLPKNIQNMTAGEAISYTGLDKVITSVGGFIKTAAKTMGLSEDKLKELEAAAKGDLQNAMNWIMGFVPDKPSEGINALKKGVRNLYNNYFNDPQFLVIAAAPSPVMVEIGNYFKHPDMIVESLKTDFSRQMTEAGPLYADFTLSLSSRQAILMDDTGMPNNPELGLRYKGISSRVSRNIASGSPELRNSLSNIGI